MGYDGKFVYHFLFLKAVCGVSLFSSNIHVAASSHIICKCCGVVTQYSTNRS